MSERGKYRKFTAQQKTELVMAALGGQKTIAEIGREHDISETLLRRWRGWREQLLAGGAERLGKTDRGEADELGLKVGQLERTLGGKTMELEVAGGALRGWE